MTLGWAAFVLQGKMEEFINAWDYMIIAAMMAAILVGLAKAWRILKNRGRSSDKSSGGDYEMIADLTIVVRPTAPLLVAARIIPRSRLPDAMNP